MKKKAHRAGHTLRYNTFADVEKICGTKARLSPDKLLDHHREAKNVFSRSPRNAA
jgi:hypothetical protein